MDDFITLGEAADLAGISRVTIWRMARDGRLETFRSGVDRRQRLVRRADIESLMRPQPIGDEAKKAAA